MASLVARMMVGPRAFALLLVLGLCAVPASASWLEDVSGREVSYQFDGDTHHDAPDACQDGDAAWSLDIGQATDGMLAPPDDPSDVFLLDVLPEQVGSRVLVSLVEGPNEVDLLLDVLAPACDGDVFALHNQPLPAPAPPAPADGEQQATLARGAEPLYCGEPEAWYFALTGMRGNDEPPATLFAAWTDGSSQDVAYFGRYRDTALYGPASAGVLLEGAWANLPAAWDGEFVLGMGPCDAPDGGAVYGEPALLGNDWIAFTPVRAGPHEVVVSLAPVSTKPPSSIPLSCHWCAPQVEEASQLLDYDLGSKQQA